MYCAKCGRALRGKFWKATADNADFTDQRRTTKQKETKAAKTYDHLVAIDGASPLFFFVVFC
jgi:hypothetical protein